MEYDRNEYVYGDIEIEPNIQGIIDGVATSEMVNKNIGPCTWDVGTSVLTVAFTQSLSSDDKTILDGIVVSNS